MVIGSAIECVSKPIDYDLSLCGWWQGNWKLANLRKANRSEVCRLLSLLNEERASDFVCVVRHEKRIDALVVGPDAEHVVLVDANRQFCLPNPSSPDLVSISALVKKNVVGSLLSG
jgi:hypothetical protein